MMDRSQNELQILGETLKRYVFVSLGYWYLFAIAIVLAIVFAKIKNRYAKSIYSIYTTIQIESRSRPELYAGGIPISTSVNLENEIGILTSYTLNYRVLKQLPDFEVSYYLDNKFSADRELYKNSPFRVVFDTTFNPAYGKKFFLKILDTNTVEVWTNESKPVKVRFGSFYNDGTYSFFIEKTENFSPSQAGKQFYFIRRNLESLANQYSNRLRIDKRSPNSSILWIWMETSVPRKDIDYLNKLAELYIQRRLEQKNEIAIKTIEFIDRQLEVFSDSLKVAEDQLQYFKQQNIDISDKGISLNEQLKDIERQIKTVEYKQNYYRQLLELIKVPGFQSVIPPSAVGIDDPILEQYLTTLTNALFEQQALQLTVKESDVIPLAAQKKLKVEQIRKSIELYINQALKYTEQTLADLKQKRDKLSEEIKKLPVVERQFMQISRKFDINNEIYTFLMERRMEAGITLASSKPDAQVLDKAVMQTLRFKRKVGYISLTKAIIFAVIIVVIIITLIFIFDNKIKNKTEIEQLTDIPIVGTITRNKSNALVPVVQHPRSTIAESFRSLKTNLLYFMVDTPSKVMLVTSTISGEGKSFITSNLAAMFAFSAKKTVILEADLRKPQIHKNFEIEKDVGISTYLIGEHTYEEILIKTDIENLWIVPSGEIPPNPVELLETRKMRDLIERLKQDFDYIIIDSPPVGIVTDALVLAHYSDIMIFVVRQLYSTKQSIRLINELREKNRIERVVIVINDIITSFVYGMRYGYGYNYGYGYGYSYGYGYYEDEEPQNWLQKIGIALRRFLSNFIR